MDSVHATYHSMQEAFAQQRHAFATSGPPNRDERLAHLAQLESLVRDYEQRFITTIDHDFNGRSPHETRLAEIFTSIGAIRHARAHLDRWMRRKRKSIEWMFWPATAHVVYQPLGVVGIVAPWNYPLYLALSPLVGALAAGNRVLLKPSEHTPETSALLAEAIAARFDPKHVHVILGDAEIGKAFCELPFDHLLFTGSTATGRDVLAQAARHLTPVTLELGGKSPAIIDHSFPLSTAAKSVMSGKLLNAGQTCIAPDYVLVEDSLHDDFIAHTRQAVSDFYPKFASNSDYTSIINEKHYERLNEMLSDAQQRGATLIRINPADEAPQALGRKFVPTLVVNPTADMKVLQEEIFGPILPILRYQTIDEAIRFVNNRARPLALYLFCHHRATIKRVVETTVSGGVCINDTMVHVVQEGLPFGGVGESGMGNYHGVHGFKTFSKAKPVFQQSRVNSAASLRPPYGRVFEKMLDFIVGKTKTDAMS